jgi:fimbrial isopeptide formation D2 family protein
MLSLKKKSLVASVAALAMAVGGLGIGAGVANAADTASLKVTGYKSDYTYKVYELGKYIGDCPTDATTKPSVAVQAVDGASDAVEKAAEKAGVQAKLTGDDKVAAAAQLGSYSSDIRKIAQNLDATGLTSVGEVTADGDVTVPEAGWYIITAENTESGKTAVASLAGTACGSLTDGSVVLKNPNGNLPGDNTDQNPNKSMVGSVVKNGTVEFTLDATMPDYSGMKDIEYAFYDYPADGLTPSTSGMKVTIGKTEVTDYTVRSGADLTEADTNFDADASKGGKDFVVDLSAYLQSLDADALKALTGQEVKVVYTATVDTVPSDLSKLNSFDVDNNGVKVPEGPDDPNPGDPGNDTPDPSDGDVQFTKVDEKGDKLDGAEFTLTSDANKDITVKATSKDGIVKFENLGEGTYTIAETGVSGAAADYTVSGSTLKVTVTGNGDEKAKTDTEPAKAETVTAKLSDKDTDGVNVITASGKADVADVVTKDDASLVEFENVKNLAQLPLTGAAGVVLFVVIATLLAGGSIAMVQVSKRNKKAGLAL